MAGGACPKLVASAVDADQGEADQVADAEVAGAFRALADRAAELGKRSAIAFSFRSTSRTSSTRSTFRLQSEISHRRFLVRVWDWPVVSEALAQAAVGVEVAAAPAIAGLPRSYALTSKQVLHARNLVFF